MPSPGERPVCARPSPRSSPRYNGVTMDPEKEITVCCGATECMIASLMAIVNPGEEVIVFEPFYENYGPDTILCGAIPRFITLHEPDWHFDEKELARAFNNKTKAIVINTPNNPTGKVFSREELQFIADLCQKWGVVAVTDEIYEHILYDGAGHVSIACSAGNARADHHHQFHLQDLQPDRVAGGLGHCLGAPHRLRPQGPRLPDGGGGPSPAGGRDPRRCACRPNYYRSLAEEYRERRDFLLGVLEEVGFRVYRPRGAYYIMTDVAHFGFPDDVACSFYLVEKFGVATVPGSSFYSRPELGKTKVRFAFPKKMETLQMAAEKLRKFKPPKK